MMMRHLIVAAGLCGLLTSCASKRLVDVTPEQFEAVYRIPNACGFRSVQRMDAQFYYLDCFWLDCHGWEYGETLRARAFDFSESSRDEARVKYEGRLSPAQKRHVDGAWARAYKLGLGEIFDELTSINSPIEKAPSK